MIRLRRIILPPIVAFLSWCTACLAQGGSHVIYDEVRVEIKNLNRAVVTLQRKIWVNDDKGKALGRVVINEGNFTRLIKVSGRLLDARGRTLEKLSRKSLREFEISPGYQLYSGERYHLFELSHATLPYTVEYSYKKEIESLFFWEDWYPQEDIPVKQSRYILSNPQDVAFNTRARGPIGEPEIVDGGATYVWELQQIPEYDGENRVPPEDKVQYALRFTPGSFQLDGISGSFESWGRFGSWYAALSSAQFDLNPGMPEDFPQFGDMDLGEKIQTMYSYLQKKTRYVAVELGIHGWKPHTAQSVYDNQYGDCKDLSTCFISLLNLVGVPAYPALILTRDRGMVDRSFPANQFNHMITFIPTEDDTLWVDCTSDYTTVWDLPYLDEGCNALVIQDGTGRVIRTPLSTASENRQIFSAEATLDLNGDLILQGSLTGKGNSAQHLRRTYGPENDRERKRLFLHWMSDYAPSVEIQGLRFRNLEDTSVEPVIEFECLARKYANVSRTRMFLSPSFFHRIAFDGEKPEVRRHAVFYVYPFSQVDTIVYNLPPALLPEFVPEPLEIVHPFGEYSYELADAGGNLVFYRTRQITQRRIEIEDYRSYYNFMERIEQQDNSKVVYRIGN